MIFVAAPMLIRTSFFIWLHIEHSIGINVLAFVIHIHKHDAPEDDNDLLYKIQRIERKGISCSQQ